MKITIDATGLSPHKTGTVTYLIEILAQWNLNPALSHRFLIFCTPRTRHHFDQLGLDSRFQLVMAPRAKLAQLLWQQTLLPLYLWRHAIDVHWGPGFVLPRLGLCPMVVTIHDMTFDLFPEVHEPVKRFYFPFMIRKAVKQAKHVLAVSESTASDLEHLIPGSSGKTVVTYLAARTLAVTEGACGAKAHQSGIVPEFDPFESQAQIQTQTLGSLVNPRSTPYVLFIGTLEPRKNLDRLLQAWGRLLPEVHGECRLVVIGVKGWMVDQLPAKGIESVEFLGHVSDQQLQVYLQGACCFVYPSLYEGFGLPVLEAMAAGVPVLTSSVGATREIAKGAALLVDPSSVDDIRNGMKRLLTEPDLRKQLSEAGLKRAREFSWARTANLTLETLCRAAKSSR